MEKIKMRFLGKNGSYGYQTGHIYNLNLFIRSYIYIHTYKYDIPYTVEGFLANWEKVE